jgi:uncharacterized membrane protein YqaE (UPF0057 family)
LQAEFSTSLVLTALGYVPGIVYSQLIIMCGCTVCKDSGFVVEYLFRNINSELYLVSVHIYVPGVGHMALYVLQN